MTAKTEPMPQMGGAYERLADGTLRLIEATDMQPEAPVQGTVKQGVKAPVKEA